MPSTLNAVGKGSSMCLAWDLHVAIASQWRIQDFTKEGSATRLHVKCLQNFEKSYQLPLNHTHFQPILSEKVLALLANQVFFLIVSQLKHVNVS